MAVLDGKNAIQRCCKVGMGGFHSVGVALPLILRPVIAMGAPWFVLVHNHPSNDPAPSPDDVRMTRETVAAARTIGVRLVDHVIVAPSGKYSSMLGLGVVDFET